MTGTEEAGCLSADFGRPLGLDEDAAAGPALGLARRGGAVESFLSFDGGFEVGAASLRF